MAKKPTPKEALEKLNNKLECTICLTDYTDPKLLPCFHVFCQKCLEPLVIQDCDGLSLRCPICRHSTKLPPKGVAGLQSDFHVEHLFELRDAFEKASQTEETKCEKCEEDNATGFCRDCGEFICDGCTILHRKWKQFKSHEILSCEEVQIEANNLIQPKKQVFYCSKHQENVLKIFCETCSELICNDCTIGLHPRTEHSYHLVSDVFPKFKDEIVAGLHPVKEQLSTVNKALQAFEEREREIEEQKMTIEADIHKEINSLQQLLEQRRTELISKVDHLTQLKLKALATQRDQVELVQVKLSSCVDYVEGGLKTATDGEVLAMKAPVMKQIEQITTDFKPATLQPEEEANLELIATNKQDLRQVCKEFGAVDIPVSSEKSYARGESLKKAIVGEQEVVVVTTMSTTNREYIHQTNLTAEMVHCKSKASVQTDIQQQENHQYTVSFQPTSRGKHQLNLRINGREMNGSPFVIPVTLSPLLNLRQPARVIGGLNRPFFATTNSQQQIIVTEYRCDSVSVLSPEGRKIHSFGSRGSSNGQFISPKGVAIDNVDSIYIVDNNNNRIEKFSSDGRFINSVGTYGNGPLQFYQPNGVAFNPTNNKIYVCDSGNHRVQILNADLTFYSVLGKEGTGNGEFKDTTAIGFTSNGNIFITDFRSNRIQIFDSDGVFLRALVNKQPGQVFQRPYGIAVDSNDTVYISERNKSCISLFTAEGEFLTSFDEGQFRYPRGLHIDENDSLLVCDTENGQIIII